QPRVPQAETHPTGQEVAVAVRATANATPLMVACTTIGAITLFDRTRNAHNPSPATAVAATVPATSAVRPPLPSTASAAAALWRCECSAGTTCHTPNTNDVHTAA